MTLPSQGKKLTESEIQSINMAVEDAGIRESVHPEKLEALAEVLVNKLKNEKN